MLPISEHERRITMSRNLSTTLDGKERFLVNFLIPLVANVLAPRGRFNKTQTEIFPAIAETMRSKEFDWCGYVLQEL